MPSKFSLQNPYIVASLPRSIDHSSGRYVTGDVFGGAPGSKKRKRSELVVGVDGEGVNLYDISTSRLITSYALPPQMSLTCPPCSIRTRLSKGKVERRTYVSTTGPQAQITSFHNSIENKAEIYHTATQKIENTKGQVVFLGTVTAAKGSEVSADTSDLLLVKENGEIQCLDGDDLEVKWTSPANALGRDIAPLKDAKVDFAHLTNAFAASQGILKGRQDIFALYSHEISEDGFNPEVLILITKSTAMSTRTLHVLTLPRRSGSQPNKSAQSVDTLLAINLPNPKGGFANDASFSVQSSAGTIQQLSHGSLTIFDLTNTIPKEVFSMRINHAKSFLRLSSTSIMVSAGNSISVYNPKYQSILASIQLNGTPAPEMSKKRENLVEVTDRQTYQSCELVSYYPKLSLAVAISDSKLVAIQIEAKSRAPGLLIDSLGCPIRDQARPGRSDSEPKELSLSTMDSYLPGSIGVVEQSMEDQSRQMDIAVSAKDSSRFDSLMSDKLGSSGDWVESKPFTNGTSKKKKHTKTVPQNSKLDSSDVDRRWVSYALRKIFAWKKDGDDDFRLSIIFYPPNVFMWLLKTGNMTVANIESALRDQIQLSALDNLPAGELVNVLVELDQDMDLLLALISRNFLEAGELLSAIRVLMASLELFADNSPTKEQLLTNGEDLEELNYDIEARVKELEAEAEADLQLAEYQLGPGSGVRGEALSMALFKLYTCPTDTIVFALQTTFTSQEIVSLIYLLRFELARGAWTSRYLDLDQLNSTDEEREIADNSIILISSLLNNCVDSIGAGGWISGDARLINGDPFEAEELIASLKLEVSAALEGIEEATYMKGLMAEMIRYGDSLHDGSEKTPTDEKRKPMGIPILLPSADEDVSILPLGLKADQKISLLRVGAGGEIQRRSARDIGRLKSQKVGKYSLERITI